MELVEQPTKNLKYVHNNFMSDQTQHLPTYQNTAVRLLKKCVRRIANGTLDWNEQSSEKRPCPTKRVLKQGLRIISKKQQGHTKDAYFSAVMREYLIHWKTRFRASTRRKLIPIHRPKQGCRLSGYPELVARSPFFSPSWKLRNRHRLTFGTSFITLSYTQRLQYRVASTFADE